MFIVAAVVVVGATASNTEFSPRSLLYIWLFICLSLQLFGFIPLSFTFV